MAKCPLVVRPHPGLGRLGQGWAGWRFQNICCRHISAECQPARQPGSQHKISAYVRPCAPHTHTHTVYSLNYRCDTQAIHPIHWTISIAEKACLSASSIRPLVPHQAACLCVALDLQLELELKLELELELMPGQGGLGPGSLGAITLHTRQQ